MATGGGCGLHRPAPDHRHRPLSNGVVPSLVSQVQNGGPVCYHEQAVLEELLEGKMKRREFMKSGFVSLALVSAICTSVFG